MLPPRGAASTDFVRPTVETSRANAFFPTLVAIPLPGGVRAIPIGRGSERPPGHCWT